MSFSEELLEWYDANRRALPWRGSRDPYRVWLSEIMLQQTRTETVKGYYARFLERFPTVFALAGADGARWVGEAMAEWVPQATRCVDHFHLLWKRFHNKWKWS